MRGGVRAWRRHRIAGYRGSWRRRRRRRTSVARAFRNDAALHHRLHRFHVVPIERGSALISLQSRRYAEQNEKRQRCDRCVRLHIPEAESAMQWRAQVPIEIAVGRLEQERRSREPLQVAERKRGTSTCGACVSECGWPLGPLRARAFELTERLANIHAAVRTVGDRLEQSAAAAGTRCWESAVISERIAACKKFRSGFKHEDGSHALGSDGVLGKRALTMARSIKEGLLSS